MNTTSTASVPWRIIQGGASPNIRRILGERVLMSFSWLFPIEFRYVVAGVLLSEFKLVFDEAVVYATGFYQGFVCASLGYAAFV